MAGAACLQSGAVEIAYEQIEFPGHLDAGPETALAGSRVVRPVELVGGVYKEFHHGIDQEAGIPRVPGARVKATAVILPNPVMSVNAGLD